MDCQHERREQRWVEREDDWTGEKVGQWEEHIEVTTRDLDTYRYQCTQCGEVMFYSGGARRLYEEGAR